MLGKKVVLTKNEINWKLNHLDWLYFSKGGTLEDPEYNTIMQHFLLQLLGQPVVGVITGYGAEENVYRVDFNTPFGKHYHFYEYPKSIRIVG